jgi:hypothetical protein
MNDSPPTTEAPREDLPREDLPREDPPHGKPREEAPLDRDGSWLEHAEELPPRPRKRILAPLPVALLLALALACGFIAGVLVQKGQGGSSSGGANGFPSLRGASAFGGTGASPGGGASARTKSPTASSAGSASTSGSGSLQQGGPSASGGAGTIGQVAYVSKGTLYVTTTEGNTVKVTPAADSKVTKTVETRVKGIHPGETVVVSGTTNANGSISASSIRAGEAGGFGGAALFGDTGRDSGSSGAPSGGGSGSGASSGSGGTGANSDSDGSTGGPALFGKE